jgi:hypothetical protein
MDRCSKCEHEQKAAWGKGPWLEEPDRVEFKHAGFACLLHRNARFGTWCGYVGVPPSHPAHGKGYDDIDVDVHGGLTYADHCQAEGPICHTPEPGQPDHLYWFGFDCGHAGDLAPYREALLGLKPFPGGRYRDVYRDQAYVETETKRLAEQLAAMAEAKKSEAPQTLSA